MPKAATTPRSVAPPAPIPSAAAIIPDALRRALHDLQHQQNHLAAATAAALAANPFLQMHLQQQMMDLPTALYLHSLQQQQQSLRPSPYQLPVLPALLPPSAMQTISPLHIKPLLQPQHQESIPTARTKKRRTSATKKMLPTPISTTPLFHLPTTSMATDTTAFSAASPPATPRSVTSNSTTPTTATPTDKDRQDVLLNLPPRLSSSGALTIIPGAETARPLPVGACTTGGSRHGRIVAGGKAKKQATTQASSCAAPSQSTPSSLPYDKIPSDATIERFSQCLGSVIRRSDQRMKAAMGDGSEHGEQRRGLAWGLEEAIRTAERIIGEDECLGGGGDDSDIMASLMVSEFVDVEGCGGAAEIEDQVSPPAIMPTPPREKKIDVAADMTTHAATLPIDEPALGDPHLLLAGGDEMFPW